MKKAMLLTAAFLALGSVFADPLVDSAFYAMDKIPAELTGKVYFGKDVEFKLEENATTGYIWTAVYDPRACQVELKHKNPKNNMPGAPGYAKVEIKPLAFAPCTVVLNYARPFETGKAPAKTLKCVITPVQFGLPPTTTVAPQTQPANATAPAAQAVPAKTTTPAQPANATAPAAQAVQAPAATAPANTPQATATASPQPATATIPAGTPLIVDDAFYPFANIPAALQANIPVGRDIDFELQEYPEKGLFWSVAQYDSRLCYVKLKHDPADHALESSKAEIEIKALAAGNTYIDFTYGSGANAKTLRVYLNLIGYNYPR